MSTDLSALPVHALSAGLTSGQFSPVDLMDACLAENDRRLSGYDPRLLRPTAVPYLVRFVRRFVRQRDLGAATS